MTVRDLREAIAGLSDDLPVYLSSDPEGNSYDTLWDAELSKFYLGDEPHPIHPDDMDDYDPDDLVYVLCLWP